MKKKLENFESSILSRNEMKNLNGGGVYHCRCGNLSSTTFNSRNDSTAAAACHHFGSECTAHRGGTW
jgi:natural product precursor